MLAIDTNLIIRYLTGDHPKQSARALRAFAGLPTVAVGDPNIVANALDLVEKGMDFADALHLGKSAHCEGFVSFDRQFVKAARGSGNEQVLDA